MAAAQPPPQRSPVCARLALFVALVPILASVLLSMLVPFLATDDCIPASGLLVCPAGKSHIDAVLPLREKLNSLVWVSVPLGVLLFFACRHFKRRGQRAKPDQSGGAPPGDLPSSDVK